MARSMSMPAASLTKVNSGNDRARQGVAPKTASVGAGASDGGACSELAKAAAGLARTKGGGMKAQ